MRAADLAKLNADIRGQSQEVYFYPSKAKPPAGRILFAPGDGGWRGFALTVAETASSWGYAVYGFDTKRYLESFTTGKSALRPEEVMADMRILAEKLRRSSGDGFIFAGWSELQGLAAGKPYLTSLPDVKPLFAFFSSSGHRASLLTIH